MEQVTNFQKNDQNPVIISEADYNTLKNIVGPISDSINEMSLAHELNRAIIVNKEAFPPNTVGLNSKVTVIDIESQVPKTFTVVVPAMADIKKGMVSILSPMGTALFGFRKGEEFLWKMPGGIRKFQITEVNNDHL